MNWNKWQIGLLAILLCAVALPAMAQLDTGSIVGVVRDKSGAVVTGADVKITNTKTGRVNEVNTGSAGEYEVPGLPEGPYRVEVSHPGFKIGIVDGIVLYATDRRAVDATLDVGQVSETMTVTADITTVNTQTSESGATIDANKVSNLPLNGRDFTSLIALVPGAVTSAGFGGTSLGGFETSLAGVNILLDGADATRIDSQATSTQLGRQASRISRASVDSIEEFKVMSSTFSAEYGGTYGDVVNVITKSGGNKLHGGLFEFFRNDAFDANNFFATQKTPLHMNQFGGNMGGPLVKDKLFFFVNYEGVRQIVNIPTGPNTVAVLTQATRDLAVPAMVPVVDTLPLPNVSDPVILGGFPRPDLGYFEGNLRNTLREDTGSVKVDYHVGPKDSLTFRYNIADSFTSTQYGVAADQVSPSSSRNHLFKATWNHTFRPTVLNEFGVAFNRPQTDSLGGGGGFPIFQCPSFIWGCGPSNTFATAPGPALFSNRRPQHSLQFLDTATWIKGRHSIRAGLNIRHVVTHDALDPQEFLAFADITGFLGDLGVQLSTLGHTMIGVQNTNYGFFVQDDIRLTPRFTVNLGVRYDYSSVLHGDQLQNLDLPAMLANKDDPDTAKFFQPLGAPLYKPDRNNFAPRIGFAWDPRGTGRTVFRGGFGIFYNPLLTGAALSLAGNYQQGFNVNLFDLLFGTRSCTPPFPNTPFLSYPVPDPLPVCTPALAPNVNALDPNMRDSYSMHWSLGMQQEVVRNTVLEVSYVANRGVKLPAGASYAGQELNLSPFGGTVINKYFGQIRHLGNFVNSNYHSMQASLRRRIGKGLNVDANYTWSHEFDDGVNILTGAYQNSYNPKGDYANGDIDVRNNFTLGAVWDVPTIEFMPKLLGKGWMVTSLVQARSGLPFPIALSAPFLGIDQLRPDYVPGQPIHPANYSVPGNQLNHDAFIPSPNGYGNVPRNAGRGPGFTQIDLGLSKTTQVNERFGIQLGAQAFNLLNHPNFSNPSGILDDPNFGKSTSTIGTLVGTGTSRQMQLYLKLIF
jgi:outer membrane receptor protein involved in Fe transport